MRPSPCPRRLTVCFRNLVPIKFNYQSLLMSHFSLQRENTKFCPVYFVIQGGLLISKASHSQSLILLLSSNSQFPFCLPLIPQLILILGKMAATHARTHRHVHAHACIHAHRHAHTRTCTHTCTHTHAHTPTHTCVHTCTHTRTHAEFPSPCSPHLHPVLTADPNGHKLGGGRSGRRPSAHGIDWRDSGPARCRVGQIGGWHESLPWPPFQRGRRVAKSTRGTAPCGSRKGTPRRDPLFPPVRQQPGAALGWSRGTAALSLEGRLAPRGRVSRRRGLGGYCVAGPQSTPED